MEKSSGTNGAGLLRRLPSVDAVLKTAAAQRILPESGAARLAAMARSVAESLRRELREEISKGQAGGGGRGASREDLLAAAETRLENLWRDEGQASLRKVINATGVVVHTNLGRAPLSEEARRAIVERAAGYCNLEYDLGSGRRGRRGARAERLLAEITGAEEALIVNNCAAAAFLVLTVLAGGGGEVVISRGELVEIGGDFRVPDVMAQSGAVLREVGTTNRTKIVDYERAIGDATRLILRVHPSNYRIVGFTAAPALEELARLAHENDLLLYEDAGSGAMLDLSAFGLTDEPVIPDSVRAGADVVTFSGDKLLGGAQAGLIVGRRETIERLRRHPLYRVLRADKLVYAATEATLEAFSKETARREIPVLRMLSMTGDELKKRTEVFAEKLRAGFGENQDLQFEVVRGNSVIGGGSAPAVEPETWLLALRHGRLSAARLEESLRNSQPPVIARILDDQVLIDLRTVAEGEEPPLLQILTRLP